LIFDEADELYLLLWPNCSTPDCDAKICIGLSETLCYPCATGKPRGPNGAIPPATAEEIESWREAAERWWMRRLGELADRAQ
jgi:hypothetical protein